MSHESDLSLLDRPEILQVIFPLTYSPLRFIMEPFSGSLPETTTRSIEVETGVRLSCGFWAAGQKYPTILYFHGNGETAGIYQWIAPDYNRRKINLFVAEYRGYGTSDGKPTITNLVQDAHPIFQGFREILSKEGYARSYFIMGRSLGSIPALEIAFHYPAEISGLIIESGAANNFRSLWGYLDKTGRDTMENSEFLNKVKIRSVYCPTLIIHGERDQIIPVQEGMELYENSPARDKRRLIIPGADHNDVMVVRREEYFRAIEELVTAYS